MSLSLSDKWAPRLTAQPETGMGYQVVTVVLKNGRTFSGVVIAGGVVTKVPGAPDVPFSEPDISDIIVTHGRQTA